MSNIILSIYLTRKNHENDRSMDDRVYVRHISGMLQIEYTDKTEGKEYTIQIHPTRLGTYIRDFCNLYIHDKEPYSDIQFNFNGYPTFMTSHESLKNTKRMKSVLESVADTLGHSVLMKDSTVSY